MRGEAPPVKAGLPVMLPELWQTKAIHRKGVDKHGVFRPFGPGRGSCPVDRRSEDIPGLVLESGSIDALIERVRYAVPELIELNRQTPS